MGTFGLWKYVAAHNVQYLSDKRVKDGVDHLFLDMNGIMHMCYSKAAPNRAATLKTIMATLQKLLAMYHPQKSLVIVFDGPAPTAKLRTQRERRQGMLRSPEQVELNEAQIVTGSTFVLECEVEAAKYLQGAIDSGKLCGVPLDSLTTVRLVGSRVPGEGETKIAHELSMVAQSELLSESYNPNDRIVVVGNDSDLILTCIACTPYHNFYVVNPHSLVATHVGELMTHWANAVANRQLPLELLPSFRTDFVFLMLLAGGDHYPGIQDDCIVLWRKYRKLRLDGGYFRQQLISRSKDGVDEVNWEFLRAVVARDHGYMQHYVGSKNKRKTVKAQGNTAAPESGIQLIKAVRWSFHMTCGNHCSDYYFHHHGEAPKLGSLRSALNAKGVNAQTRLVISEVLPLLPLQVYTAVIGVSKFLPKAIQEILTALPAGKKFEQTTSVGTILEALRDIFGAIDEKKLTSAERVLMKFGDPSSFIALKQLPIEAATKMFEYPAIIDQIRFLNLYDSRYVKLDRVAVDAKTLSASTIPSPGKASGSCEEPVACESDVEEVQ